MTKTNKLSAIQPLNYSRQIREQCIKYMQVYAGKEGEEKETALFAKALDELASQSVKFHLPEGGRLIVDHQLRALDGIELHLPYPIVALEFRAMAGNEATKFVTFAVEDGESIVVWGVVWSKAANAWGAADPIRLSRTEYLTGEVEHGIAEIKVRPCRPDVTDVRQVDMDAASDVLSFLNALACSNVHVERGDAQPRTGRKKAKTALPFDTYHYLTIDVPSRAAATLDGSGWHRSPREHLRRGHIRRLESGTKIWVNAAVVNPGVGGKVEKDYRLAA